jgi:virulence factor Mce-like protein
MQKQAPTFGRLMTMTLFALSCFGLLLFLWLSFGGAIPLKPRGYRVKIAFPQATQVAIQADVRVAGISVGKVVDKQLDPQGNRTDVTGQLDPRFAPLHSDAQAILRQKTLLGETFVELTPGTTNSPTIRENGFLSNAQVKDGIQLDQVLKAFDPTTRQAFRSWQQDLAAGAAGQGQALNDALGNLPGFARSTSDLFSVLNAQSAALHDLVLNTGVTFAAINHNTQQLHNLIVNAGNVFDATAAQQNALAQTFKIFPTFLDESKATFQKLQGFSTNTEPLIRDLGPATHDLTPTLRDVRSLAPDLRQTFVNLDPLITASQTGLPALQPTLSGIQPLLANLDPFLEQLNPLLQWLEYYQAQTSDFISNGASPLAAVSGGQAPGTVGHYLRQIGPVGAESVGVWATRPPSDRGNSYLPPIFSQLPIDLQNGIFPNFDCKNTGAPGDGSVSAVDANNPLQARPGCFVAPPGSGSPNYASGGKFAHVGAANYKP